MNTKPSPDLDRLPNVRAERRGKSRCDLPSNRGAARSTLVQSGKTFFSAVAFLIATCSWEAQTAESNAKPLLLYCRHYNAEGETRYLPDGTYKDIVRRLREEFDLQVHSKSLTPETLADVKLLLIANPSDKAVGHHPPPPHVSAGDIKALTSFVEAGGGFIIMGNQENHNLETDDVNKLLARFGIQFTNLYTDAKQLVLSQNTPILGGLRWAYYTGNLLLLDKSHPARPRPLIMNDLDQKPAKGTRDQSGCLLAVAEPGKGRVVVVTDSGWITDSALDGRGIGDVAIKEQDNWEIFRRLARWAAQVPAQAKPAKQPERKL